MLKILAENKYIQNNIILKNRIVFRFFISNKFNDKEFMSFFALVFMIYESIVKCCAQRKDSSVFCSVLYPIPRNPSQKSLIICFWLKNCWKLHLIANDLYIVQNYGVLQYGTELYVGRALLPTQWPNSSAHHMWSDSITTVYKR